MSQYFEIFESKALKLTVILAVCAFWGMTQMAFAQERPYADGPLTPNDYRANPPNTLPRDPTTGVEIHAETAVGSAIQHNGSSNGPQGNVTYTPTNVTVRAVVDRNQSWNSDPQNANLLDHEQGHLDIAEAAARAAQAEVNQLLANGGLTGHGANDAAAQADLENQVQQIFNRHNNNAQQQYDDNTNHGTNPQQQAQARAGQRAALAGPNQNPANRRGPNANSRTGNSITFDAGVGRLTIDQDFIVEVLPTDLPFVPDPFDPILGAQLFMPTFSLVQETFDSQFFFKAEGPHPQVKLDDGTLTYFAADLDYMLYDPRRNMFYGLTTSFASLSGFSHFVDEMIKTGTSDDLTLFGVEFFPDHDFFAATAGLTNSASDSGTDGAGQRRVAPVPEPSTLALFGIGTLSLFGYGWRVRMKKGTTIRHQATAEAMKRAIAGVHNEPQSVPFRSHQCIDRSPDLHATH